MEPSTYDPTKAGKKTPYSYTANDNYNFLKKNAANPLDGKERGEGQKVPMVQTFVPRSKKKMQESEDVLRKIADNQEYIERQKQQVRDLVRQREVDHNDISFESQEADKGSKPGEPVDTIPEELSDDEEAGESMSKHEKLLKESRQNLNRKASN